MKSLSLLFVVLFATMGFVYAQDLQMTNVIAKMDKGKQPAIEVIIPESKRNYIKRQWKRYLRSYDNNNLNKKRKKVLADNIVIPSIREFPLNIFTHLEQKEGDVRMRVFIQIDENKFMGDDHDKYEAAKNFVKEFAIAKAKEALSDRLDDLTDKLDDKRDDMEDLKSEAEDLEETIEDCKETIKESEQELKKNEQKQKEQKQKVEMQKQAVEKVEERLNNLDQ